MKKLTKKEVAKLRSELEFIEALYESIEHDIYRLRELEAAYIVKAAHCPHRHPTGKLAFKLNPEPCENCGEKHRHCSICGLLEGADKPAAKALQLFPHIPHPQKIDDEVTEKMHPRFGPN